MNKLRDIDLLLAFGKHLRKLRKDQGLSQEQLGFKAQVSKNQVGEIERGEINPTLCTLNALAEALEIELPHLININFFSD